MNNSQPSPNAYKYGHHPYELYYKGLSSPLSQNIELPGSQNGSPGQRARSRQSTPHMTQKSQSPSLSTTLSPVARISQYATLLPDDYDDKLSPNFLQPVPPDAKGRSAFPAGPSRSSQRPMHSGNQASFQVYTPPQGEDQWDPVRAPSSLYFPPRIGTSLSTSNTFAPPSTPRPSTALAHGYGYQVDGPTDFSGFLSLEAFVSTSSLESPKVSSNKEREKKSNKRFQSCDYVLVRDDSKHSWIVGTFAHMRKYMFEDTGARFNAYIVDVTTNVQRNDATENSYTVENILDIPEDDTPHITPSHQAEASKLMQERVRKGPVTLNSFLFAAIKAKKTYTTGGTKNVESWYLAVCLGAQLLNNRFSVRVIKGELKGKEFNVSVVKPYGVYKL